MKKFDEDIFLFQNDLSEYKNSKQGKEICEALISKDEARIEKAFADYWSARNADELALTWDSEEERQQGREFDKYLARLYSEQN